MTKRDTSKSQRSGESSASPAKKPRNNRREPRAPLSPEAKIFVGKRIAKYFDDDLFFGTIETVEDVEDGIAYYSIKYDDDDSEELDASEVRAALQLYLNHSGNDPKLNIQQENNSSSVDDVAKEVANGIGDRPLIEADDTRKDKEPLPESKPRPAMNHCSAPQATAVKLATKETTNVALIEESDEAADKARKSASNAGETEKNEDKKPIAAPKPTEPTMIPVASKRTTRKSVTKESSAEGRMKQQNLKPPPTPAESPPKRKQQPPTSQRRSFERRKQQREYQNGPTNRSAEPAAAPRAARGSVNSRYDRPPLDTDPGAQFPVRGARWRLQVGDITRKFNAATNETKYLFQYEDGTTDTLDTEEEVRTAVDFYNMHEHNKAYISMRVAKRFDGKPFFGSVVSYDLVGSPPITYFRVLYDDGDEEEYDKRELTKWIRLHDELRGRH